MGFIDLEVRTALIVHGFDDENHEIVEELKEATFVRKVLAISRVLSLSEQYILVSSSHGRVMYWEYKGTLDEVKYKLLDCGVTIA